MADTADGVWEIRLGGYQIAAREGKAAWWLRCTRKITRRHICNWDSEVNGSEKRRRELHGKRRRLTVQIRPATGPNGARTSLRQHIRNRERVVSTAYGQRVIGSLRTGSASDTNFKIYRMNDPLAEYRVGRASVESISGNGFNRFTEVRWGSKWRF